MNLYSLAPQDDYNPTLFHVSRTTRSCPSLPISSASPAGLIAKFDLLPNLKPLIFLLLVPRTRIKAARPS